MKSIQLLLCIFLFSCSSKKQIIFSLYPDGQGLQNIGLVKKDKNYLENTCEGTSRFFKLLIDNKSSSVLDSVHLQRYNLELIELFLISENNSKYEIKLTQSGCIDSQLAIDFNFYNPIKDNLSLIESIRRAIKDLAFTDYAKNIQKNSLKALTKLEKNINKYCKMDINFVAYKKRTFCSFKSDDLYYQLIWGLLDDGKEIINLTSSYTSF